MKSFLHTTPKNKKSNMNLSVRNLSPVTSLEELQTYFETFGGINDISISTYMNHGKVFCLGQVEMYSREHGLHAIAESKNKIIDGNLIKISEE